MVADRFELQGEVWRYPGAGGWHFLTLPVAESEIIRQTYGSLEQGWGSLAVEVAIGRTRWKTSLFWDSKSDSYLLPLKAEVRKREKIEAGDTVTYFLAFEV